MSTQKTINAVERTFKILEQLSLVPSSNLEELAKTTKLAKPTVYRFLQTLRELGYVKKNENDHWFLTLKLFSLGSSALDHIELSVVAKPIAERLSHAVEETVHVGILDEDEALYILKIESSHTICIYSRVGKHIPLYCSAIGKILLAFMKEEDQIHYLNSIQFEKFTPNTHKDKALLIKELEEVRHSEIARDREEHEEGIICLASPIRKSGGQVVAALSISWPVFRFEADKESFYIQEITRATNEISAILGWDSH